MADIFSREISPILEILEEVGIVCLSRLDFDSFSMVSGIYQKVDFVAVGIPLECKRRTLSGIVAAFAEFVYHHILEKSASEKRPTRCWKPERTRTSTTNHLFILLFSLE